jgi:predicted house-cleaning noncanonical NTP pyrophosphatase (MazG superfamily)
MPRIEYNKIVRDRIPEIIAAHGDHAEIEIVSKGQARVLPFEKLLEEAAEAMKAPSEKLGDELGDIVEVVRALAALDGISPEQLETIRREKYNERGGFGKRVKLIATT